MVRRLLSHRLPWLQSDTNRACMEVPLEGVPECCSGARARRKRWCRWYGRRRAPPGACHVKATSPPSHVGTQSEHPPIACSHTASHGSNRACMEVPLEGVPECCSGARARRERWCRWYGRRRAMWRLSNPVGHSQEHAMSKPHRRQATWAPRVSVRRSRRCLLSHQWGRADVAHYVAQCCADTRA